MSVWFGQGQSSVEVPPLSFYVEEVSGEWWLYSYIGAGAAPDLAKPSTHKSEAAARRRARKIYRDWLREQIKIVEGR